jgi:hypothetical protein
MGSDIEKMLVESYRWLPLRGEKYFLIVRNGKIISSHWCDTPSEYEDWRFGNCFKNRKDAKKAREAMKDLLENSPQKHADGL